MRKLYQEFHATFKITRHYSQFFIDFMLTINNDAW